MCCCEKEYQQRKTSFVQEFISVPLSKNMSYKLNSLYDRLSYPLYDPSLLYPLYIKEIVTEIKDPLYKRKFLIESFLHQFDGLDLKTQPVEYLKILHDKKTFEVALLFKENNFQSFFINFLLEIIDSLKRNQSKISTETSSFGRNQSKPSIKTNNYKYQKNDYDYDDNRFSETLYWEAVHDGEIDPDDDYSSYGSHDDDDDYYLSYKIDYTKPYEIDKVLEPYVSLVISEYDLYDYIDKKIDKEVKSFLIKYIEYTDSFDARHVLKKIKEKELVDSLFAEFVDIGKAENLDVNRDGVECILFKRKDKSDYLKVSFDGGPGVALFIDNIKENMTTKDLQFCVSVLQIISCDIDESYIDFAHGIIGRYDSSLEDVWSGYREEMKLKTGITVTTRVYKNKEMSIYL